MSSRHLCFLCDRQPIPNSRALCPDCFDRVPWKLRIDFMNAYRRRGLDPAAFGHKYRQLIRWKQYINER